MEEALEIGLKRKYRNVWWDRSSRAAVHRHTLSDGRSQTLTNTSPNSGRLVGFGRACAPVRCAPHPSSWAHCHAKRGAARPLLPAYRSFAVSYFTPQKILNLSNLGRPRQGPFSFHRNTDAMKYEVHLPPASPIAALLILPAIFWGQNYVPVPPYALIFFGFSFL